MTVEIGVLIAIGGLLVSFLAYQLNRTKEVKTDTRQDAKIQAQLDYIGKGVDDIRIDLKANERQMVAHGERITRLEESAKQAHKRIDTLEKENDK
ncbi:hypothetical protein V7127_02660 [Bacillus sp. JJ1773]|uniref:hypothetical protein n=1 Tax=Bacillus sp. JJ1773 TaxID=3122965 RepID=UPI003000C474